MNIVRHVVVAAIVLPCAAWGPTVSTSSEDTAGQVQQSATEDEIVSRTRHAEKVYRHRLARLHRLRELAVQGNDKERLRALDALFDRLYAVHSAKIERMQNRKSGPPPRRLDALGKHSPDDIEPVPADLRPEARKHRREKSARKHDAFRKHQAKEKHADLTPHDTAAHRRAEAHEHAAAQKRRAERWRGAAKQHTAGNRRAEAHKHAAAQKRRAERWRDAARHPELTPRRADVPRGRAKVQHGDRKHVRRVAPGPGHREKPKHDRALPEKTPTDSARLQPDKDRHRKLAPGQKKAGADASAAAITRENADAEFEKLRKEIESDG